MKRKCRSVWGALAGGSLGDRPVRACGDEKGLLGFSMVEWPWQGIPKLGELV